MNKHIIQKLFEPYKLGDLLLPNRFVMASMTRCRCDPKTGVPTDLHVQYYSQRASAGLILSECTPIANNAQSFMGAGGVYTKDQVQGWKKVIDAIHAKGGRIFDQIWHAGRSAHPDFTGEENIGPSAIAIRGDYRTGFPHVVPREMTIEDIKKVQEQFRRGALNAKEAGFDGIELHGGNGYIIDEFLRDSSNRRTDEYGGSIENRCRFALEVMDILIEVFGKDRVGIKLSPVGRYQDMHDKDPVALYGYLLKELDKKGIAYVQLMESGERPGRENFYEPGEEQIKDVCKTLRPYFKGTIIINNNQTPETGAKAIIDGEADLVSFARYFLSNPDFIDRVKNGWKCSDWDSSTFYKGGEKGYVDYALYNQQGAESGAPTN